MNYELFLCMFVNWTLFMMSCSCSYRDHDQKVIYRRALMLLLLQQQGAAYKIWFVQSCYGVCVFLWEIPQHVVAQQQQHERICCGETGTQTKILQIPSRWFTDSYIHCQYKSSNNRHRRRKTPTDGIKSGTSLASSHKQQMRWQHVDTVSQTNRLPSIPKSGRAKG